MSIDRLVPGDRMDGFYLLQRAAPRTTANGRPFLTVTLADRTGSIDGQVWDYAGPLGPQHTGQAVKVRGSVGEYRGARQVTVERIRLAFQSDGYDPSELIPTAPIDADDAWNELLELAGTIRDEHYAAVCRTMLERFGPRVRVIPAGKSVHHAFRHGLLMHTLNMARAADFLADLYYAVIDRDLLLCGTILHDFAKNMEFDLSPLGVVTDYSVKGQLLGHLVMGAEEVGKVCRELNVPDEKETLLKHLLLSHHGEPAFGAAVLPQTAESELLSYIDMIDSRMEIYRETFEETPVGAFSKRVFALDRRVYNHGLPPEEDPAE